MIIGEYNIKPVCIYLTDTTYWMARTERAKKYFASEFIEDIMWVKGIHAENAGIKSAKPYLIDQPDGSYFIPQKTTGVNVSIMMTYAAMASHPEVDYWMMLEDDCRFVSGWQSRLKQALKDVPSDFDYLFGGSCCCADKPTGHIKGEVFEVKYPFCGHMTIMSKNGLLETMKRHLDLSSPGDIEKTISVFPFLKVYTILPRIAEQEKTDGTGINNQLPI